MIYKGEPAIKHIILHHTAVSRSKQPIQYDSVNKYHKSKWNMVSELGQYTGYNFFCEASGALTQARKIGEETIAQIGMNCDVPSRCLGISFCMAGDFRVEKPTKEQVAVFRKFIKDVKEKYPNVTIIQHKDADKNRTCAELTQSELNDIIKEPSKEDYVKNLEVEVAALRQMVNQLMEIIRKHVGRIT